MKAKIAEKKNQSDITDDDARRRSANTAGDAKDKRAADTERYEALARDRGADLSEQGFNEALGKIVKSKVS